MFKHYKKSVTIFMSALTVFLFSKLSYAEHPKGEDCRQCHSSQHNNDEYKLLSQQAILEGKIPCFTCHAENRDKDAPNTQQEFTAAQSHHPLGTDKECLICHNLDEKHNNGRLEEWPDMPLKDPDPQDSHVYQGGKINDFCLSCHDNSPVTLGDPAITPIDLSSAYEFTGHGRIDINEACNSCHEHHASFNKPYLIKDVINNAVVTGNDNSVCFACHTTSDGSYAGQRSYEVSEHGLQNKLCIDCHNPHGDNKDLCYLCHNEQYNAHYSTKRDKLCIDCHNPHQKDGLKMTREDEEKLCFLCHKELEKDFGNIRDGKSGSYSHHKVDDEEYKGGKIECTDCHNPHTITKFNIVTLPEGHQTPRPFSKDAYSFKTQIHDDFCLHCHDGSRFLAKNIKSELDSASALESEFSSDGANNLHKIHQEKGFGCPNCHNAHSSEGTAGIKRGALLHEDIVVHEWDESKKYFQGRNSCSASRLGLGCH